MYKSPNCHCAKISIMVYFIISVGRIAVWPFTLHYVFSVPQKSCFIFHFALTNRGTYCGDVICLQVVDHFLNCLDAFFCSEVYLMVFTANMSCNLISTKHNQSMFFLSNRTNHTHSLSDTVLCTLRAAMTSGLSSEPIEKVWMGYCSFSSLASFTSVAATKLESSPPEE